MRARDRNLVLAALILSAAGAVGYFRIFRSTESHSPITVGPDPRFPGPADRIANLLPVDDRTAGGRDIFRDQRLVPPQPQPGPGDPVDFVQPLPPTPVPPVGTKPTPTPGPGIRPQEALNMPLVYSGFARDETGNMTAFLETTGPNAPAGHFNLQQNDVLFGRYVVARITPETVEMEDLDRPETNRKQTVTRK